MKKYFTQEVAACVIGICIGALSTYVLLPSETDHEHLLPHPIADPFDSEYHTHADFMIYVGDERVDLAKDEFMTTATNMRSSSAHLHDGNGDIEHIHTEDLTFATFLDSLNITLTSSCLTVFDGPELCSGEENEVLLYVNGDLFTRPISQYIPMDDDSILLYYGNSQDERIQTYINEVSNDSCYYSGTCPERGIAPSENCGLTCEL